MYAIAIFDANLNGNKYVSKNGVDYTIHNTKTQSFTLDEARRAIRQWFPNHLIVSFEPAA